MAKRFMSALMVLMLVLSVSVPGNLLQVNASPMPDSWNFERYGDIIDVGPSIRTQENPENLVEQYGTIDLLQSDNEGSGAGAAAADSNFTYNGGTKYFLSYNSVTGSYGLRAYTLRSLGQNVEVWVSNNLAYPYGDARPTPVLNQEQVDKVRDEFDFRIYPTDTEFFGTPENHTGQNAYLPSLVGLPGDYYAYEGQKNIIILVDNIRDEQYYDPEYPFFIAGFYSPSYEVYFDRNVISIDAKEWETRLETTFLPTVAHEFQHLIHDDNDGDEDTWLNEGMADFAEYLCGYGQPERHINFFLDHPENSLVSWDEHVDAETGPETLADYGQAYLITYYMYEKFGPDFIQSLAKDTDNGIESVNKILEQYSTGIDFNELFRRFSIAVAIDSRKPGNGIYSFDTIDGLAINFESAARYSKPGVPAWGADYITITDPQKIQSILFDGIDFLATPWKVTGDPLGGEAMVLWGSEGNLTDNSLIFEADLTNVTAASIKFDHYYFIEEFWDYGMVQVSTDSGQTWTSLANGNTRSDLDPNGHPNIQVNLPGFTGTNEGWTSETFDLTPYAGQTVYINFRYMTDWASLEDGWFIKNIEIPEIGLTLDGTDLEGFMSMDRLLGKTVDYAVTFINREYGGKSKSFVTKVQNIDPFNITEEDILALRGFMNHGDNYLVVWYAAAVGNTQPVDYSYELRYRGDGNPKIK
ncbi:MAG: peptidase M6 [Pseudomonadota bacterium]